MTVAAASNPPTTPSWLLDAPTDHLALHLLTGATAAQTCIKYPFASYYLYVPTIHPLSRQKVGLDPKRDTSAPLPVVVVVHGSGRDAASERDRWQEFGETHGCVIVSPLFPIDVTILAGLDNYKQLVYGGYGGKKPVYFDQIMLDMLQEISDIWGSIDITKFNMVGFSGGGQFAHRFFYLHPDRLKSISIGAPGNATFLDSSRPWPQGIRDVSEKFYGLDVDIEKLQQVPCQLFVGSADVYHTVNTDGSRAELSRYGVLEKLSHNFKALGLPHSFDVEPGVKHRGDLLLHLYQPFVLKYLR